MLARTNRCPWAERDELCRKYHDEEWGVPQEDDRRLFELLVLEGAQAGLSWHTILHKRDAYREAYSDFDPRIVAAFGEDTIKALLGNTRIVRHRLKIRSAVVNAQAFLAVQKEYGSFSQFLWKFTGGVIKNHWGSSERVPSSSPISEALSKDLRMRGFQFVGPTICYSYLQASGRIVDHLTTCFLYPATDRSTFH